MAEPQPEPKWPGNLNASYANWKNLTGFFKWIKNWKKNVLLILRLQICTQVYLKLIGVIISECVSYTQQKIELWLTKCKIYVQWMTFHWHSLINSPLKTKHLYIRPKTIVLWCDWFRLGQTFTIYHPLACNNHYLGAQTMWRWWPNVMCNGHSCICLWYSCVNYHNLINCMHQFKCLCNIF